MSDNLPTPPTKPIPPTLPTKLQPTVSPLPPRRTAGGKECAEQTAASARVIWWLVAGAILGLVFAYAGVNDIALMAATGFGNGELIMKQMVPLLVLLVPLCGIAMLKVVYPFLRFRLTRHNPPIGRKKFLKIFLICVAIGLLVHIAAIQIFDGPYSEEYMFTSFIVGLVLSYIFYRAVAARLDSVGWNGGRVAAGTFTLALFSLVFLNPFMTPGDRIMFHNYAPWWWYGTVILSCLPGLWGLVLLVICCFVPQAGQVMKTAGLDGTQLLYKAVEEGNVKVVELFLRAGADVNSSVWNVAVETENAEIVKLLLRAGADANCVALSQDKHVFFLP